MKAFKTILFSVAISTVVGLSAGLIWAEVFRGGDSYLSVVGMIVGLFITIPANFIICLIRHIRYRRRILMDSLNLDSLPKQGREYIKSVGRYMGYLIEVRLDVMNELAGHFEDALRDCRSEEERQQKAQELIEGFGDAKLLGKLLRRAKKRCRPVWRTVVARTGQVLFLLIIFLVVYVGWFFAGEPKIMVNYLERLNELARPEADKSMNAAPYYLEAAEWFEALPREVRELITKDYDEVNEQGRERIRQLISDSNEMLTLAAKGTEKPYYWRKYEAKGIKNIREVRSRMPALSGHRYVAKALCWRAILNAEHGRGRTALNDLMICYRQGLHIKSGKKGLIEQLTGTAIEAIAVEAAMYLLSRHSVHRDTLADFQKELEDIINNESFAFYFEAEKLGVYDEIQRCFTGGGFSGEHLYLPRVRTWTKRWIEDETWWDEMSRVLFRKEGWLGMVEGSVNVFFLHPDKQETRETADRLYEFAERASKLTPAAIRAEELDLEERAMEIVVDNILLQIITPPIWKVSELMDRVEVYVKSTVTLAGILRFEKDKGRYPENLQELLESGYVKQIPIDPFSDEPLKYKRRGEDFVLYSVGTNFQDDGGVASRNPSGQIRLWGGNGDAVFWPVEEDR